MARIRLEQLPAALARTGRSIERAVRGGALDGLREGRRIVQRATPKDTGELRASWGVRTGVGRVVAVLHNDAPYAALVESGAGPHPVPPAQAALLRRWVERHIGRIAAGKGKVWLRGARRKSAIANLAGKIIKRIETRGFKPRFYARRSLDAVQRAVQASVVARLAAVGRR
jgi:bacteriophage HK97-gp10 putative tail-component